MTRFLENNEICTGPLSFLKKNKTNETSVIGRRRLVYLEDVEIDDIKPLERFDARRDGLVVVVLRRRRRRPYRGGRRFGAPLARREVAAAGAGGAAAR